MRKAGSTPLGYREEGPRSLLRDGDGQQQRVRKTSAAGTVDYLYDLAGNQISEVSSSGGWNRGEVYAGGKHLATYDGGASGTMYFIHADWLGTERARTDVSAAVCETIVSLPFGDGQSTSGSCSDASPLHFTGKMRDTESGLDDFGARYYSSRFGRWNSPDWAASAEAVPYANFSDPQSLNLYNYVRNNVITRFDRDGHDVKDYRLLTSGPNQVPNSPSDAQDLGPSETPNGTYFNLNTQANFDEGDSPANYRPLRTAYILNRDGGVQAERSGPDENPSKGQIANSGNSQYVYDGPGAKISGLPRAALNMKYDAAFALSEKNIKTGQVSAHQFFYRVTFVVQHGKITGYSVTSISQQEFLKVTGQAKKNQRHNNK